MISPKRSNWLKISTVVLLLLMMAASFLLYQFLFDYDENSLGTSILPMENIDIEAYESLLDEE